MRMAWRASSVRIICLATAAALGLAVAAWWPSPADRLRAAAGPTSQPGFVDDKTCSACHAPISAAVAESGMGQAWRPWDSAAEKEDRSLEAEPQSAGQLIYKAAYRGGLQVQREFRRNSTEQEHETMAREASHVLGSGRQGRTYIWNDNGYLRIMPLGWYSRQQRYDMSPDYRERNLRFERTVATRCMSCHNAMVQYLPGSFHAYAEPLPMGLGCQRCHGPGASHIASYSGQANDGRGPHDEIVNPAALPFDRQQDVCLQCHLSGTVALPQPDCDFWSFRPGMRLRDVRSDFIDTSKLDALSAVGHGPRSMASACYQKSNGRMTCTLCHDPHHGTAKTPVADYNRRCLDCHQTQLCDRPLADDERPETGNCVLCHMPKRLADDIPHTVATEHWIRRNPNDLIPKRAGEAAELLPFWPDTSDGQLGSALVEFYGERGQFDQLAKGMALLQQALAARPGVPEWEYRMGLGHFYLRQWPQAVARLRSASSKQPHLVEASAGLGETLVMMNQRDDGIDHLEKLIERLPYYYRSDVTLMRAYWESGKLDRMLEMEQKYFVRHPDDPERLEYVARAMDRLGYPFEQTRSVLDRAIRADGLRVQSRLLLAQFAMRHSQAAVAEQALGGAVASDPESSDAAIAWAGFLMTYGRPLEARVQLQKVLDREPGHPEAQRMLRRIRF